MKWFVILPFALAIACSSGSEYPPEEQQQSLSAQELLQNCVSTDLNSLADLFNTLTNLIGSEEGAPVPEFNLLAGILAGGVVPWTLDLDRDGKTDLGGTVFFEDDKGNVTIPIDLTQLLSGGIPENIEELLAGIPEGTKLNITYDFNGLLTQSSNSATGSGAFAITFGPEGTGTASGNSLVRTGDCSFEFDFKDIDPNDFALGIFPLAEAGFDLQAGSDRLQGSIFFDGTDVAEFHTRIDGGALEIIRFDLKSGLTLP